MRGRRYPGRRSWRRVRPIRSVGVDAEGAIKELKSKRWSTVRWDGMARRVSAVHARHYDTVTVILHYYPATGRISVHERDDKRRAIQPGKKAPGLVAPEYAAGLLGVDLRDPPGPGRS